MKSVLLRNHGGPEELAWDDVPQRAPGSGEVEIEVTHAGVNFMDIGVRRGLLWRDKPLPLVPGVEGAGVVTAVGEGVTHLRRGQSVAWPYVPGSYAQTIVAPSSAVVAIPDEIGAAAAAGMMMQGLTAMHIALRFHDTRAGDVVLIHAAAGGVGGLLTQLVKMRGGTVIGRVSSASKVASARSAGADHVIVDAVGQFAEQVSDLTNGRGVSAVFDGSGEATFGDSMASLAPLGTLAYFGPVLGAPPPVHLAGLKKSVKLGFPIYSDSIATHEQLIERTSELFNFLSSGTLYHRSVTNYPMSEAGRAHADIEGRRTEGKLLLTP